LKSKKEKFKKKSMKKLILKINKSKGFKNLNKLKKNFIIKLIDLFIILYKWKDFFFNKKIILGRKIKESILKIFVNSNKRNKIW
jgi:hypothetical protein